VVRNSLVVGMLAAFLDSSLVVGKLVVVLGVGRFLGLVELVVELVVGFVVELVVGLAVELGAEPVLLVSLV